MSSTAAALLPAVCIVKIKWRDNVCVGINVFFLSTSSHGCLFFVCCSILKFMPTATFIRSLAQNNYEQLTSQQFNLASRYLLVSFCNAACHSCHSLTICLYCFRHKDWLFVTLQYIFHCQVSSISCTFQSMSQPIYLICASFLD